MLCSQNILFATKHVHSLIFFHYEDDSLGVTFHTRLENHRGNTYRPFLTPSVPAYEVPSIGKTPEGIIYLRDSERYQDSILVLLEEGVLVPGTIKAIKHDLVLAQLTEEVIQKYVIYKDDAIEM